jgi:WD40 repeat protein
LGVVGLVVWRWQSTAPAVQVGPRAAAPSTEQIKSDTPPTPQRSPLESFGSTSIQVATKPFLVLDADGHTDFIKSIFFTRDRQRLISMGFDKAIRIWDVASGETIQILRVPIGEGNHGILQAAALSPDGKWLAVAGMRPGGPPVEAGPIYIINLETGKLDSLLPGGATNVLALDFSADGQRLAAATAEKTIRIFDFPKRRLETNLEKGHTGNIIYVAFSPDGQHLLSGAEDRTAAIWSLASRTKVQTLAHPTTIVGTVWTPDGKQILTGCIDGNLRRFDISGSLLKTIPVSVTERFVLTAFELSSDGRKVLCTGSGNIRGQTILIDLEGTKQVSPTAVDFSHGTISKDGKLVASVAGIDTEILVWNAEDGTVLHRLQSRGKTLFAVGWSADGKSIGWGYNNANSGDELKQQLERTFRLDELEFGEQPKAGYQRAIRRTPQNTPTFSRDQKELIFRAPDGSFWPFRAPDPNEQIYCWTLLGDYAVIGTTSALWVGSFKGAASEIHRCYGHSGPIRSVAPSPDGRYFATASHDQTIRIWDPKQTLPLLSMFIAGSEWIAWTPEGYYAASPGGERLMGWQVNNGLEKLATYHPAVQFRKSLYRPDVIKLLLPAGSTVNALAQADRGKVQKLDVAQVLPPEVNITSPAQSGRRFSERSIEVQATARSVGNHPVTALRLLLDGRPYGGQKNVRTFNPPKAGTVQGTWTVELPPGKHTLAVQADSAVSRGLSSAVEVVRTGAGKADLPNLYIMAAGISAYPGDLRLNYAASDAELMTKTFRGQQAKAFAKVEIKLIQDKRATRAAILDGLKWLKDKMSPQDIGLIFLSGHGLRDDKGNFHFVPIDVDQKKIPGSCLSGEQMKPILAETPGRIILMLDACHSGAAGPLGAEASKKLADNLIRDLVTDDYGVIVISSSRGTEFSLESPETKAGYFTFAFTEGLGGPADLNRDGFIYLSEIDQYCSRRVGQLSEGQQHPVVTRPPTIRSFPLGRR